MNIPKTDKERIVIIGGGFGGLQLAKNLRDRDFQVVLIDKHNYHAFQPLFYQVATAGLEPGNIAYPLRKIFNAYDDFYFRMAELKSVDTATQTITTNIGELKYNHLVIATGATTNYFGNQQMEKLCMPMKTVSEALNIRSLMLQNFERALLTDNKLERDALMSVVLVGGGPTGVELAGALAELKIDILPKDYPDLDIRQMGIHILDAGDRLISGMSPSSSERALRDLRKMGVLVHLNKKVTAYDGQTIQCGDDFQIQAALVIWAAGVKAVIPQGIPDTSTQFGRIRVNEFSEVVGIENVYAIGDVAVMVSDDNPKGHAMVAQPAIQQGALLAKNLVRKRNKKSLIPFKYKDLGSMATIGRNKAVAELSFTKLTGWLAWAAWLFVHVYQLIGFRNRIFVLINWSQNYFRHARDLRLIIRPFNRNLIEK